MSRNPDCRCGNTEPHVIARAYTHDNSLVEFWSDGSVTGRFGVPSYAYPLRTRDNVRLAIEANWVVKKVLPVFDASSLKRLVHIARRAMTLTFHAEDERRHWVMKHAAAPNLPELTVTPEHRRHEG
jgi:hypothetical protein